MSGNTYRLTTGGGWYGHLRPLTNDNTCLRSLNDKSPRPTTPFPIPREPLTSLKIRPVRPSKLYLSTVRSPQVGADRQHETIASQFNPSVCLGRALTARDLKTVYSKKPKQKVFLGQDFVLMSHYRKMKNLPSQCGYYYRFTKERSRSVTICKGGSENRKPATIDDELVNL